MSAPERLGLFDIAVVKRGSLLRQFLFARQRDVVELDLQVLAKDREILFVELTSSLLLAHEAEKEGGVHALGGFLHVLRRENTAIVLAQNHVDRTAEFGE